MCKRYNFTVTSIIATILVDESFPTTVINLLLLQLSLEFVSG